jgi:hypothetical protein
LDRTDKKTGEAVAIKVVDLEEACALMPYHIVHVKRKDWKYHSPLVLNCEIHKPLSWLMCALL